MDVIVSHVNADFDSLGGLVGARLLYPEAITVLPGGTSNAVKDFLTLHRGMIDPRDPAAIDPDTITRVVVVDTSSRSRLGKAAAWLDIPNVSVHLFDHHTALPPDFPTAKRRIEEIGSVSALLANVLRDLEIKPSPFEATAMLLGIYEDTGSLTYSGTTPQDLEAAAWLLRCGGELEVLEQYTRRTMSPDQRRLFTEMLEGIQHVEAKGVCVVVVQAPRGPYVDEAAVLLSRVMETEDAEAAIALLPMDNTLYLIGRSRSDAFDVGTLMREMGGGGHARAASAMLKDADPGEVHARLVEALPRHATHEITAREIMSYPPRSIEPEGSVAEARKRMIRYGHSGLLVMEGGKLVGILTRRDVDKARHHRLEHAPVKGYMTRDIRTATPETPLSELERMMIRDSIGRLPVVRDGEVLGIVTRTDVLKASHGVRYLAGSRREQGDETRAMIRERIPAEVQRLLERAGRLAVGSESHVYVVGGFVRDLLVGNRNLDVDLLVEPDAIRLAQVFAQDVDGELKVEERFGTAHVILPRKEDDGLPDRFQVDFATARTESYARPGALPEVEHSSVSDDLRRRDFTINAMAIALRPERFGELLDPFGGRDDLDHRRIRVLHNLSFTEDPTRLIRAVRFEERYHFRMDHHTEELATHAIAEGALGNISPERLRRDLFLLFREAKPIGSVLRLESLGILRWLHPDLRLDEALLRQVPGALEWWRKEGRDHVNTSSIYLAAILANLPPELASAVSRERLRLPPLEATRLQQAVEVACRYPQEEGSAQRSVGRLLDPTAKPSELTARLKGLHGEALVLLRAAASDNQKGRALLDRFMRDWRQIRLEITGDDLKSHGYRPGPRMGDALQAVLDARINGEVAGREQELAMARRILDGGDAKD